MTVRRIKFFTRIKKNKGGSAHVSASHVVLMCEHRLPSCASAGSEKKRRKLFAPLNDVFRLPCSRIATRNMLHVALGGSRNSSFCVFLCFSFFFVALCSQRCFFVRQHVNLCADVCCIRACRDRCMGCTKNDVRSVSLGRKRKKTREASFLTFRAVLMLLARDQASEASDFF